MVGKTLSLATLARPVTSEDWTELVPLSRKGELAADLLTGASGTSAVASCSATSASTTASRSATSVCSITGDRVIRGEVTDSLGESSLEDRRLSGGGLLFDSLRGSEGRLETAAASEPDDEDEVASGARAGGPARMMSTREGPESSPSSASTGGITAARGNNFPFPAPSEVLSKPTLVDLTSRGAVGEGGPARRKSAREAKSSRGLRVIADRG